jgi:choline kinase
MTANVAICTPVRDQVNTQFAYSLANLTSYLERNNTTHSVYFENGSVLPKQRNDLVQTVLERSSHTHIMWLDSDMVFPRHTVNSLLKHKRDVIACTYSTRHKPYASVAFTNSEDLTQRLDATTGLHNVWAVGMGCVLVNCEVYRMLPKPWYMFEYNYANQDFLGEDLYFCKQLEEYDIECTVDIDLSKQVTHVGSKEFKLEDTHVQNSV